MCSVTMECGLRKLDLAECSTLQYFAMGINVFQSSFLSKEENQQFNQQGGFRNQPKFRDSHI